MPQLRLGMNGADVQSLQLALVAIGLLSGEPDGQFDTVTQRGVMELQRRAGLPQTGVVDDATWNALYQMQASVAPTTGGAAVGAGGRAPGTIQGDTVDVLQPDVPSQGSLLFFGLAAGLAYWFSHKDQGATNEYDEDDDEDEDEDEDDDLADEDEDLDFEPSTPARLRDLDDAVTDSLLDEPAVVSRSGRPGDCKKAAMLLMRRAGLAQRPSEQDLYGKVVRKVASNCRGAEEAIEEAIADAKEEREEIEDEVGAQLTSKLPQGGDGFRKTKRTLLRKTTGSERSDPGVRGRGRRGAGAIAVRRGGKLMHKLRKEKAKTKRGYTWRKEEAD